MIYAHPNPSRLKFGYEPMAVAAKLLERMETCHKRATTHFILGVLDTKRGMEYVIAQKSTDLAGKVMCDGDGLIGVYTKRITPEDIVEDIEAWQDLWSIAA